MRWGRSLYRNSSFTPFPLLEDVILRPDPMGAEAFQDFWIETLEGVVLQGRRDHRVHLTAHVRQVIDRGILLHLEDEVDRLEHLALLVRQVPGKLTEDFGILL